MTVAAGDEALNTFDVVRVQRSSMTCSGDPGVILLSPFGFQTKFWELTQAGYNDSFVARVALAGYDVWMVDNRTADLAPGSCESEAVDCTPLADWGVDTGVADAMFVQKLVKMAHPGQKPVVGGFSGGSSAAIASVNSNPNSFSGLFMWEGTLFTKDPAIRARNAAFCAQDEDLLADGVVVDASVQGFKAILNLATAAPSAPSPIPGFPPGTTNLQALIFAFSVPNPANPLNFTDGFVRLVGDPFAATLTYSNLARFQLLGPLVGNYAPVRFLRDSHCAMGGLDTHWTSRLNKFKGGVLVYAAGLGFGQMMLDTASLMTKAHVTVNYRPELGESDFYYLNNWQTETVTPFTNWLNTVDFH